MANTQHDSVDVWLPCASEVILKDMDKIDGYKARKKHRYSDVRMSAMASQIKGTSIVYSAVCSGAYQAKRESSVSMAFLRGIHRWQVDCPRKGPVTRTIFSFDDVIMWPVYLILALCFSCS